MKAFFLKAIQEGDLDMLQVFTRLIALSARNEMEDFHVKYLSDKQMKELNPLIRKGIYNMLVALANSETNTLARDIVHFSMTCVPQYWEQSELHPEFAKIYSKKPKLGKIRFKADFLNQQLKQGNLFFNQHAKCIQILPSYEFKNITLNAHKHRDKISSYLRKEGYYFVTSLSGYIKRGYQ